MSTNASRVEVLNTGSELLFGSVVNTHLAYLGQKLFPLGLRIQRQTTVPDGAAIKDAVLEASPRSEIILITGGLGPTSDDITRELVAELTGRELDFDESILAKIRERFERRNLRMTERISRQAYVIRGSKVLPNDFGTAPGLYVPAEGHFPHLFLLPGPPRELKPMFENYAFPILRTLAGAQDLEFRVFRTSGLGESYIEEMIGSTLAAMPDLELGYCARLGEVDVRIIGPRKTVQAAGRFIESKVSDHLVSSEAEEIEEVVIRLLRERRATVATAESCTGGLLANRLTDVPGASEVFLEGATTYSNPAKTARLDVPAEMIEQHGAVSSQVAEAMAEGILRRAGSTYALATTGVAGPGGATIPNPVGTVYLALAASGKTTKVEKQFFPTDRISFKTMATQYALDLLRRELLG